MNYVVAVDVGGTDIKSALVDSEFTIVKTIKQATPKNDFTGVQTIEVISGLVREFEKLHPIDAVGLVIPGALDEVSGKSRWSGNLQWRDLPIRDLLQSKIKIPVAFGHDVRTAAIAELRRGAASGARNAIFIPIGTGIAAALIMDGQIVASDGYAGEIGHINVNGQYQCVCGKKGCLEAISSTLAISKAFEQLSNKSGTSTEEIFNLVKAHDPIAIQVWEDATSALARACEILITVLAPEIIVFGGGLSNAGETLISPIQDYLNRQLTFQRMPKLEIAHFGAKAGTVGSAMMAFDLMKVEF